MTLADAARCASDALSASASTPETAQRVYDFAAVGLGGLGRGGESRRRRRRRRPGGGDETAAGNHRGGGGRAVAAPAPANAAAVFAAAARDAAARDASTNPYGVRDLNFVRLGRPPKNPAAIAAAAARDAAADAENADAGDKNDAPPERACRACAAALVGAGRPYYHCANPPPTSAPTATERDFGFHLCGACFFSGALPDGTPPRRSARGGGRRGGNGKRARRERERERARARRTRRAVTRTRRTRRRRRRRRVATSGRTRRRCSSSRGWRNTEKTGPSSPNASGRRRRRSACGGSCGFPSKTRSWTISTREDACAARVTSAKAAKRPKSSGSGARSGLRIRTPRGGPRRDAVRGAPNPVMANVAFLATCVGPRVAAAAARASLAYLSAATAGDDDEEEGDVDVDIDGKERVKNAAKTTTKGWTWTAAKARDRRKKEEEEEEEDLGPAPVVTAEMCRGAAAAGFAAAAVKAKLLADQDEHEIQKLVVGVVEMQMRKIELKLRHVEELDAGLNREREGVERIIAQLAAERVKHAAERKDVEERLAAAAARRRDESRGAAADGVVEVAPVANAPAAMTVGTVGTPNATPASGA